MIKVLKRKVKLILLASFFAFELASGVISLVWGSQAVVPYPFQLIPVGWGVMQIQTMQLTLTLAILFVSALCLLCYHVVRELGGNG